MKQPAVFEYITEKRLRTKLKRTINQIISKRFISRMDIDNPDLTYKKLVGMLNNVDRYSLGKILAESRISGFLIPVEMKFFDGSLSKCDFIQEYVLEHCNISIDEFTEDIAIYIDYIIPKWYKKEKDFLRGYHRKAKNTVYNYKLIDGLEYQTKYMIDREKDTMNMKR